MSAIAGFVAGKGREPADAARARRMLATESAAHDGAGAALATSGDASFAASDDGAVRCAIDGEAASLDGVRADLGDAADASWSAARVALEAYERWGARGLAERIDGACAVAVWDARTGEATLVRDRFGLRPLFYVARAPGLAFASSLRAVARSGLCLPKVDEEALWALLVYGYAPTERTPLAGVRRVPPGGVVTWSADAPSSARVEPYWELPPRVAPRSRSLAAAATELRSLLDDAVGRRTTTGSVACLLSGGLDSATVAAVASTLGASLDTFHLALPDAEPDAGRRAAAVARALGARHTSVDVDGAALAARVDAYLLRADEPADVESFGRAALVEAAGGAAALTGDGADELFCGRERYLRFATRVRRKPLADRHEAHARRFATRAALAERFGAFPAPDPSYASERTGFRFAAQPELLLCLLDPSRRPPIATLRRALRAIELEEADGDSPLDRALRLDARLWLRHAVGGRVASAGAIAPLLDRKIVELAFDLPDALRATHAGDKLVLRAAAAPLRVPAGAGASAPLDTWFRTRLLDLARDVFDASSLVVEGILDREGLHALLAAHAEEGSDAGRLLWSLLALDRWWKAVRAEVVAALPERGAIPTVARETEPTVEILIPVYEGFNYVRDCVRSVRAHTRMPFRAILLDDAGSEATHARLVELVAGDERFTVARNERNLGFLRNCNRGFESCTGDYVVLLNSDTVVAPGWLERMVACAESDPRIAVVNPLSNESANTSVRIAPGLNLVTMARRVAELSRRDYPDLTTGVGMCMLVRRSALDLLGGFDEIYAPAYCEETDLCMRYTEAGLRVVAADDAFIYHKGSASYEEEKRRAYYERNREVFDRRWSVAYERDWAAFSARDPLQYMRDRLLRGTLGAGEDTPRTRAAVTAYARRLDTARALSVAAGETTAALLVGERAPASAERGTFRRLAARRAAAPAVVFDERRVAFPSRAYVDALPPADPGKLRITFLVSSLGLSGGVLSIVTLAKEMMALGHDVRFVTEAHEIHPELVNLPAQPLVYRDREHLLADFPASDVVVATFWVTAHRYLRALHRRYDFTSVYFIQDYEAWFYSELEVEHRRDVVRSYAAADHRIVMSRWMADMVERHDTPCDIVNLGLDLGVYYPRGPKAARPRVVSVAAPGPENRRRGFPETAEAFRLVHAARPDAELVFFGAEPRRMPKLEFPYTNVGRLHDPNKVAELVSTASVLVDASLWQGFGRPGLEAMACATAPVLTNEGGLGEYARDGENALLVPPGDPEAAAEAIVRLLDDDALRTRFAAAGSPTAARFSHELEARRHLDLYRRWVEERSEGAKARPLKRPVEP